MKIGILGEKKSVLAFRALGVDTFGIDTKEDLIKAKERIKSEDFAVLFITEDVAGAFEKEAEEIYQKTLPAVLVIPGVKGKGEKGRQGLKKILERALGSEMVQLS